MDELTIRLIVLALWLALTFNLVSNNLKRIGFIQAYSTYSSLYRKLFIPVVYASYAVINAIIPLTPSDFVTSIPIPREKSAILLFAHSDNYLKLYHQYTENPETLDGKEKIEKSREELISVMEKFDPRNPNSEHKYIYVNNDKEEVEKFGLYVIPFDEWEDIQKVPTISEDVWEKAKIINLLEN